MSKKVGRPPKADGERRDEDLRIPVTPSEKQTIRDAAKIGSSRGEIADWARRTLLETAHDLLNQS